MAANERAEVLEFLQSFNSQQVKYLVVGGYAVNHYGYSRTTSDIDIYVKDTPENRKAIINALEKLYPDLMINKDKTGRTKDKDDFEQLSKIRREF